MFCTKIKIKIYVCNKCNDKKKKKKIYIIINTNARAVNYNIIVPKNILKKKKVEMKRTILFENYHSQNHMHPQN
jgi:hypothetical protein